MKNIRVLFLSVKPSLLAAIIGMSNMNKILILICFITSILFSQTVQLGFRSESTWYNTTINGTEFVPLWHFFITAGLYEENTPVLKDLTEEIRFGRILTPGSLIGNDLSFALKSHLISKFIYLTGGLNLHFNQGSGGGPPTIDSKIFNQLILGIGITPDKPVFIELSEYFPISNTTLEEYDDYDINNNLVRSYYNIKSFISLNFGLIIDLSHNKQ